MTKVSWHIFNDMLCCPILRVMLSLLRGISLSILRVFKIRKSFLVFFKVT